MDAMELDTMDVDTRTKLILAAERLFGERGIDAVTLREVMVAAGQRNESALKYHIGGRNELVAAIFDYRRAGVDARRIRLLDEYAATTGAALDEGVIAAALTLPLVDLMLSDPRGGNYLRFLSQTYVTDRPEASYLAPGRFDHGTRRCLRLYRERHPDVPPRRLRECFYLCGRGVIYGLADWQRDKSAARSGFARSGLPQFATDLIRATGSGLASIDDRDRAATSPAVRDRDIHRMAEDEVS